MSEKSLRALGGKTFEDLKLTNTHGAEYWSARDLQAVLGYSQWRRFEQAIERAKTSCKESGNSPDHHFAGAGKPITGGKGAVQIVDDYHHKMFGVFHDAGYKGLYGGLGRDAIKVRKAIPDKDNLLDRMNATELAANQFRMTQTRDKLSRERIQNQSQAIQTHEQVGKEVRDAIKRIGGAMPENIAPAEHIKEVEKRLKTATPKLELDERDASGLLGETREKQKDE